MASGFVLPFVTNSHAALTWVGIRNLQIFGVVGLVITRAGKARSYGLGWIYGSYL